MFIHNSICWNTSRSAVDFSDVVNIPDPLAIDQKWHTWFHQGNQHKEMFLLMDRLDLRLISGALFIIQTILFMYIMDHLGVHLVVVVEEEKQIKMLSQTWQLTIDSRCNSTTDTLTLVAGSINSIPLTLVMMPLLWLQM